MKLFRDKKSLILISTLLIICFLIVGCGNKTSVSKTPSQPNERQEIKRQEETKEHIQDGQEQADSQNTADSVLNVDDANSAAANSDVNDVSNKGNEQEKSHNTEPVTSVTVSIVGPKDTDVIMKPTEVEIAEGDTVLDVLKSNPAKQYSYVLSRQKSTAYVEGINNLFELTMGRKRLVLQSERQFLQQKCGAFTKSR